MALLGVDDVGAELARLAAEAQAGGTQPDTSQASADFANRVNSAGTLIRSGFTPGDSLTVAGLPPVAHTGLLPVTVQRPDGGAAINAAGNVTGRPDATTEEPTP